MLGTRGIWHKGWFANTVHAATPAGWSHFDNDRWELFHIESDRSQCHDLAAEQPGEARGTQAAVVRRGGEVQRAAAGRPQHLRDAGAGGGPTWSVDRKNVHLLPGHRRGRHRRRGRTARAVVLGAGRGRLDTTGAEGVLYKHGAGHGGHVLYVQDGRLHYIYNFMGEEEQQLSVAEPVPPGSHVLGVRYERTGTVEGSHTPLGDVSLYVDETVVATRAGRAHASRQLRPGGRRRRGGPQHRTAGVECLQGAVRVHRRHHRPGRRRRLRNALHRHRARTGAAFAKD